MRLHHLQVQAFGPFPDTTDVDFDQLSAAGLFLLAGPTGAGKTSVLDAVCFALYGDVPGARGTAKRLRCDTAPADRPPRVVLEVTLAGRRFRFTRSPAWQRPKRRGTGFTPEQARVICEERVDGNWEALSTRLDETGHLVSRLVGMTMRQFCQVALLPQGEFQGFLRARSDERHALLQQLFSTARFEEMERWVREAARAAGRDAQALADRVRDDRNRLEELVRDLPDVAPCPAEALVGDSVADDSVDTGALTDWASRLAEQAEAHAIQCSADLASARTRHEAAQAAVERVRTLASLQQRGLTARRELAALAEGAEQLAQLRERLAAGREAAALLPLHRLTEEHVRDRDLVESHVRDCTRRLEEAATALGAAWWPDDADASESLHCAVDTALDRVTTVLPLVARRREAVNARAELTAQIEETTTRRADVDGRRAELPARIRRAEELVERLGTEAGREPELARRRDGLVATQAHLARLRQRVHDHAEARSAVVTATDAVQAAREQWLDLREQRINGMAAELAGALTAGCGCPVCGSPEHPAPASSTAATVTADDEKVARSHLTDLEFALTSAHDEERSIADDLTRLRALTVDHDEQTVSATLTDVEARHTAARRALDELPAARDALTTLRKEHDQLTEQSNAFGDELAALRSRRDAHAEEVERAADGLADVLADYPHDDVEELHRALRDVRDAVDAVQRARLAHEASCRSHDAVATEFAARLGKSVFGDRADLLRAVEPEDELARIEELLAERERREARAHDVLDDPEIVAALAEQLEPVDHLEGEARAAEQAWGSAHAHAARAERLQARLLELRRALTGSLETWLPLRERHRTTADLAAFLEGKSADNALRMRLSSYVLAWRLGQVVAAANERLATMTDGRYTLLHTARRAVRETRGGLSLAVRDDWSGQEREPATLSGGETFVVSLALALGLADVVTAEAGGTSLDTLFVDEGFGALDAETLDDVLDTLDDLREGGRVVGVVSHVAEMRARVPTQLVVSKAPEGSRLRVTQR